RWSGEPAPRLGQRRGRRPSQHPRPAIPCPRSLPLNKRAGQRGRAAEPEFLETMMRAESQTHIDEISAATALLRRFLDWDRAQRRLEELNAKVEEPALWDDPKAAQEVMR